MTKPIPYTRSASFTGSSPYRDATLGASMDAEFNAVKTAMDATQANLALIQRDDGQLANQSVGLDQITFDLHNIIYSQGGGSGTGGSGTGG